MKIFKTKNHHSILFLFILINTLFLSNSFAQEVSVISPGRISVIEGHCDIYKADDQNWAEGQTNYPLYPGDVFWTEKKSLAEIILDCGVVLRLGADTKVKVDVKADDLGSEKVMLRMSQGSFYIDTAEARRESSGSWLKTPSANLQVLAPGLIRVDLTENGDTEIYVLEGEASVSGVNEKRVVVKLNQVCRISMGQDPNEPFYPENPPQDDLDRWNLARREALSGWKVGQQAMKDRNINVEISVHPPFASLAFYGSWNYLGGGFGWVWEPDVYIGWRPYFDGNWVWRSSWGWTWVSFEPWGWYTYHYGNWVWVAGYGWVWRPDTYWGPCWVDWYWGSGWIGWVPSGPWGYPCCWYPHYGPDYYPPNYPPGTGNRMDANYWVCVHEDDFTSSNIRSRDLPEEDKMKISDQIKWRKEQPVIPSLEYKAKETPQALIDRRGPDALKQEPLSKAEPSTFTEKNKDLKNKDLTSPKKISQPQRNEAEKISKDAEIPKKSQPKQTPSQPQRYTPSKQKINPSDQRYTPKSDDFTKKPMPPKEPYHYGDSTETPAKENVIKDQPAQSPKIEPTKEQIKPGFTPRYQETPPETIPPTQPVSSKEQNVQPKPSSSPRSRYQPAPAPQVPAQKPSKPEVPIDNTKPPATDSSDSSNTKQPTEVKPTNSSPPDSAPNPNPAPSTKPSKPTTPTKPTSPKSGKKPAKPPDKSDEQPPTPPNSSNSSPSSNSSSSNSSWLNSYIYGSPSYPIRREQNPSPHPSRSNSRRTR